jgi:thioredoxin 1
MKAAQKGYNPEYSEDAPTLDEVKEFKGKALIEFGAPWCGHCQAAQPHAQEVLGEQAALTHIKVFDGKGKPLGRAFKVKLWPTFILLHNGKEIDRLSRPNNSQQLQQLLSSI